MEPRDELPLALRRAYLAMHRKSDARFADHEVTADQFVLLASLARGHAVTQRELATRMDSDPSTVQAMLVLLEKRGLVTRDSHPSDARAKTVSLTAVGKRKFRRAWEAGQPIRDQMVGALTVAETQTLVELLRRVSDSLMDQAAVVADASGANSQ